MKNVGLFADLNDESLAILTKDFRLREYRAHEVIFHQGDPHSELYVILQGKVRIFRLSPAGKETTIQIFSASDTIGEFAAIDGQPRSATAKTLTSCQLLEMNGTQFLDHMRAMPDLAIAVARVLTNKLRWTAAYAETIAQFDAAGRLLHLLLLYKEQFGQEIMAGKQYALDLPLNQADLASLIGARREWVNRLLKDWLKRNLISIESGKIIFLDLPQVLHEYGSRIEAPMGKW